MPDSEHDRKYNMHTLKLTDEMRALGLQRASGDYAKDSFILHSLSGYGVYETWEKTQRQAHLVCESFFKNYGGECKDVSQLDPEELLANSLWPVEIYYKDFGKKYTLTMHVGRRLIPGTQGEIENSWSIHFELFRDRYQECLDSYKEPDDFRVFMGSETDDPYIECADLKR